MSLRTNPHSSWAKVYDLAYDLSFGEFYHSLTTTTIQLITEQMNPGGSIVDFGSGTGRLSIPLADKGFEVVAVDPCQEMLYELEQKKKEGMKLRTVCSKMQNFEGSNFDFAVCVFTVLLYLLDEESINNAFATVYEILKPNGILLVDIPSKIIFQSYSKKDDLMERSVSVIEEGGDIYRYKEELKLKDPDGGELTYSDEFQIRYWSLEYVSSALTTAGFALDTDLSNHFSGTGSHYWMMRKVG